MSKDREIRLPLGDGTRADILYLPFAVNDTNDAMHEILDWLADSWEELI